MTVAAEKAAAVEQYHQDKTKLTGEVEPDAGMSDGANEALEAASEAMQAAVVAQEEAQAAKARWAEGDGSIDRTRGIDDFDTSAYG